MGAIPLPEGSNAAETIRRLRAIDAEIFGTVYANAGIIGEDLTILGDVIASDIYSSTWDGTVPLSLPDVGALGYALQSAAGIAQFETLYATGAHITGLVAANITVGQIAGSQISDLPTTTLTGVITTDQLDALAVTAEKVAASAVTTEKIAADAVEAGKIADDAVGEEHVQDLAISEAKVAAGAITVGKIGDLAVTSAKINADAVTAAKLADDAVGTEHIQALAVHADEIATNAVTNAKILAGAVDTLELADAAVATIKIEDSAVTTTQLLARTILAGDIATDTITAAEIAADTITASQIAADTITATQIAAGTLTATEILAGTITSTEIATDTILAGNIAAGAIDTLELNVGAVTYVKMADGVEPVQVVSSLDEIASPVEGMFAELNGMLWRYNGTTWLDATGSMWTANGSPSWAADDSHVSLDGASDWFSTPDVNLLGADEAHFHQSKGSWTQYYQSKLWAQSTALTPQFGDFHLEFQSTTTGSAYASDSFGSSMANPVSPSTEYAVGAWVSQPDGLDVELYLASVDSVGGIISLGSVLDTAASPAAGQWYRLEGSRTLESNAVYALIVIGFAASAADQLCYVDGAVLALGSDGAFVPSKRIVGDVDMRAKLAPQFPSSGGDQIIGTWDTADYGYRFTVDSNKKLVLGHSPDGTTVDFDVATTALTTSAGEDVEVRVVLDLDGGTGGRPQAKYYENGVNFENGDTTGSAGETQFPSSSDLSVGRRPNDTEYYEGKLYWAEVRDGIDGPVVARFEAGDFPSGPNAWTNKAPASSVSGQIVGTQIRDGAITTDKVFANAITATQIAAGTITGTEIDADTITAANIAADTITATQMAADSITSTEILARTILATDIGADQITAYEIAALTITASQIAADAIISDKILADAITTVKINAGAITTDKINVVVGTLPSGSEGQIAYWAGSMWQFNGTGWFDETGRSWATVGGDVTWAEDDTYALFPGTAGDYAITADTNLLDADTAHLQQSVGQWTDVGGQVANVALSSDLIPVFGDTHGYCTPSTTTASPHLDTPGGTGGFPVVGGTVNTFSASFATDQTDLEGHLWVNYYDSGGTYTGDTVSTTPANLIAGAWLRAEITDTAPATAAFYDLQLRWTVQGGGNLVATDKLYWDAVCVQAGTVATFVPSMRMVGDIDLEVDIAPTTWSGSGANQFPVDKRQQEPNEGFYIRIYDNGNLAFRSNNYTAQFVQPAGWVDGERHTVRFTMDASESDTSLYADGVYVSTSSAGTPGPRTPSDKPLILATELTTGSSYMPGKMYSMILKDGIDGPIVARFDAGDFPDGPAAWSRKGPASAIAGQIQGTQIRDGSITTEKVVANAITTTELNIVVAEFPSPATAGQLAWKDGAQYMYNGVTYVGPTGRVWTSNGSVTWNDEDTAARLPGSNSDYLSAENVNLLDADTAHIHQSIGGWVKITSMTDPVKSNDVASEYGDYVLTLESSSAALTLATAGALHVNGDSVAFPENTVAVNTLRLQAQIADTEARAVMITRNAGGGLLGVESGPWVPLTTAGFTTVSHSITTPATNEFLATRVDFRMADDSPYGAGTQWYMDTDKLAVGSDPTFVPSVKVVEDLDIRFKGSAAWSDATNGMLAARDASGDRCWNLYKNGSSQIRFEWSSTGASMSGFSSGGITSLTDGVHEIRVTLDSSASEYKLYVDGVEEYTNTAGASSVWAGVTPLLVGEYGHGGLPFTGDVYWMELRDGIDGPVVARFDAGDFPGGPNAWTRKTTAMDVSGSVVGTQIRGGVITTEHVVANAITTELIDASAVTATEIAANTITTDRLVLGSADNLISNPSFESGVSTPHYLDPSGNWTVTDTAADSNIARSGDWQAQVNHSDLSTSTYLHWNAWVGATAGQASAAVGDTHYAECYVRGQGTIATNVAMEVHWLESDGTYISGVAGTTTAATIHATNWVKASVSGTAPALAAYVAFRLRVYETGGSGDYVAVDDGYARRKIGTLIIDDQAVDIARMLNPVHTEAHHWYVGGVAINATNAEKAFFLLTVPTWVGTVSCMATSTIVNAITSSFTGSSILTCSTYIAGVSGQASSQMQSYVSEATRNSMSSSYGKTIAAPGSTIRFATWAQDASMPSTTGGQAQISAVMTGVR